MLVDAYPFAVLRATKQLIWINVGQAPIAILGETGDIPMPMFEDREKVAEREFEQEREFAFKVRGRRNKLLGMWAAGHMGLVGAAAERYARTVVDREIVGHDDESVIAKIRRDLVASGSPMADEDIRAQMATLERRAHAQQRRQTGGSPLGG
jgi:hypothetical protein